MASRILLLGATGRTGKIALGHALAKGVAVNALVRSPEKISQQSPLLNIVIGRPDDPADVAKALEGCTAVVSALNNNRTSDAPWAKPASPPFFMTNSMKVVTAAMKKAGVRRLVIVSSINVNDDFKNAPALMRWLIRNTNLRHTFQDHDAQEPVVQAAGLDYTIVRAAGLLGRKPGRLILTLKPGDERAGFIGREQLGRFIIDCVERDDLIGKTLIASEK